MIKIKQITQTSFMCPSQWDAITFDNQHVYIRERWDVLSVGMGDTKEDAVAKNNVYNSIVRDVNISDYAGVKEHLTGLLDFSEAELISYETYLGLEDGFSTHSED